MRDLLARLFTLLAAFAAVVQWSVPHGWMIGEDDAGRVVFTPCPGTSPHLAALVRTSDKGAGGHHAHHDHQHFHDHAAHSAHDAGPEGADHLAETLCDQAAVGAPVLLPEFPQLAALPRSLPILSGIILESAPGRGLAAPPPPSTGPPSVKL